MNKTLNFSWEIVGMYNVSETTNENTIILTEAKPFKYSWKIVYI